MHFSAISVSVLVLVLVSGGGWKSPGKSNWKTEFLFLVWFWYELDWIGLDWIGLIFIFIWLDA
jgi:hypothetical protein